MERGGYRNYRGRGGNGYGNNNRGRGGGGRGGNGDGNGGRGRGFYPPQQQSPVVGGGRGRGSDSGGRGFHQQQQQQWQHQRSNPSSSNPQTYDSGRSNAPPNNPPRPLIHTSIQHFFYAYLNLSTFANRYLQLFYFSSLVIKFLALVKSIFNYFFFFISISP